MSVYGNMENRPLSVRVVVGRDGDRQDPKIYLTGGPMPARTRKAMEDSKVLIPPSYKAFILRFGNANLYRKAGNTYLVRVYAAPREVESDEGESLLHFGRTDLS